MSDDKWYKFAINSYTAIDMNTGTYADQVAAQLKAAQLWVTSVHKPGSGGSSLTDSSNNFWTTLDLLLNNYSENVYKWLYDRDFQFASETRSGIGDVDLDLFYEHMFSSDFVGEVCLGVRFPTGGSDDYCGNPYRPHTGNGSHWEIKVGALAAWQALSWLNIKADAKFAVVLESEEKISAAFTGATVKNIGPCAKADIDWQYVLAHLDFNLFHPETSAISTVIGYEFYYKSEDNVKFKNSSMQSWLGKKYNTTTSSWDTNNYTLDNKVAEMNTESIAHKIRLETSFRITQYFEMYCGAAYTFAGQNIPRECDGHFGFVVTF